jgi:hypothetical protein
VLALEVPVVQLAWLSVLATLELVGLCPSLLDHLLVAVL